MRCEIANEARSAELAIIISYPTSASGIIVLLKTSTKTSLNLPDQNKPDKTRDFRYSRVTRLSKIGSLSRDVFERRTSTGSELFSLLVCLDANKFVLLSFFSPLKTIYSRVSTKPLPNDAKSSLPVDVRRSKTLLLKLPTVNARTDSPGLHE